MKVVYYLPLVCVISVALPQSAIAYIGPGAGISVIGAALALIAAIIFAIAGFLWYPLRKWSRRRRKGELAKGDGKESKPPEKE